MTFYSYGLPVEQQPGSLSHSLSLAAVQADTAAVTEFKGPRFEVLSLSSHQSAHLPSTLTIGAPDPFSSAFSIDFGGGTVGGTTVGKIFFASNAEVAAISSLKFLSHFPSLQAASTQAAFLLLPNYRGQRRLAAASGEAAALSHTHPFHAVVAATQANIAHVGRLTSKALLLASAQAAVVLRAIAHGLASTQPQMQVTGLAHGPGLVRGVAGSGVVAGLKSTGRILSAINQRQVSAVPRVPSRVLRVVSASAVAAARSLPYHVSGAISATSVALGFGGGNLFARVFGAASGEAALLGRGLSVSRPAFSPESARLLKGPGRLLGIAGASTAGAVKAVGHLLGVASVGLVGSAVRLPRIVRGVASGTAVAALPARLVASLTALAVVQAENVLAVIQRAVGQALALPHTQTASLSISSIVTHLRALALLQGQAVAAAVPRSLFRFFAAVSGAAQASVRSVGYPLAVAASEAASLLTLTQRTLALSIAGTTMVFVRASHGLTRSVASNDVAAVVVLRLRNTIVGALAGSVGALRRGIAYPLTVLSPQAIVIARAIGKAIPLASASAASLIRLFFRFPATTSSQVAHLVPRFGSTIGGVVSLNAAFLLRRTSKLAGLFSQQVAAAGRIDFKIIGTTLGNVASMIRPRGLKLGAVQSQVAAVARWFFLFVPDWASQQTVLLPPGGGPAEPPDFGPIDPLDQTTFAFNWASRADPNDPIVSATVVSVPPGLTFAASPVFISGMLVQVTVVPSVPPLPPAVYTLRCTAVFASGRRSSFSIPVPVRIL